MLGGTCESTTRILVVMVTVHVFALRLVHPLRTKRVILVAKKFVVLLIVLSGEVRRVNTFVFMHLFPKGKSGVRQ